jgi:two-component system chemotaxis response regulator CheB
MKHHGAHTIVQDENSSLIWGMPKSAIELGAAQEVLALHKIGSKINHLL